VIILRAVDGQTCRVFVLVTAGLGDAFGTQTTTSMPREHRGGYHRGHLAGRVAIRLLRGPRGQVRPALVSDQAHQAHFADGQLRQDLPRSL
jgi:hypothetical protein